MAENSYTAFASAMWFYMTPQSPKPSMHDVITGLFAPNEKDKAAGITGGFGSTINVINGGVECGGPNIKAEKRGKSFKKFLKAFGIDPSNESDLGCANERSFPAGGTGDAKGYFQKGANPNSCELTSWQTEFSMYARDDYKRCVCESWGNGEEDCP